MNDTTLALNTGDSKSIITNQTGIHEKLDDVVKKHLSHAFQKPYQAHTQQAFTEMDILVNEFLAANPNGEIILDACCGVGQSTRILAQKNSNALVIGVDKSAHRIHRNVEGFSSAEGYHAENYHLVRADLNDFYRLVNAANWPVTKHYILYPNPWPKAKHLQRRWHGSAVFPQMITIGETIILRSNWRLYLEEFQQAARLVNLVGKITELNVTDNALTPFEAKYQASAQVCWQLQLCSR
ncbi:MAG: SAM-dependent methyltransferase [Colwellia sp.]